MLNMRAMSERPPVHDTMVPLRWSDVDAMNHVNNVCFVDYADEARFALIESGVVAQAVQVSAVEVEYVQPEPYGDPLTVRTTISEDLLVHEMYADGHKCARAFHHLGGRLTLTPLDSTSVSRQVTTRRSDVGAHEDLRSAVWTELVQESRVAVLSKGGKLVVGPMVVAHYRLELGDASEVGAWFKVSGHVAHVGPSSAVLESDVVAGAAVGARAASTIVAFDPASGRSRPWTAPERALLEARRGMAWSEMPGHPS